MDSMTNRTLMEIRAKTDALREQATRFYEGLPENPLHDPNYMTILRRGLQLKKSSDIFSDEERKLFDEIDTLEETAKGIFSDLSAERYGIEKAIEKDSLYADSIRPQGQSLPELLERNENEHGAVTDIITDLMEVRSIATGIGWGRYKKFLYKDYKRTTAEIRAIVKALKTVRFVEADLVTLELPHAIYIQLETDYYKAESLFMQPKELTYEKVAESLDPLLYHHRKALIESEYSTSLIDTLIRSKSKELAKAADISISSDALDDTFTTSVDTYIFTKDKVSNQLTKLVAGKQRKLALENHNKNGKGTEITTLVTLNFDKLSKDGIPELSSLDNMDRLLLDALFSVWVSEEANGNLENGVAKTTLQVLYRIITKNPNSRLDAAKEQDLIERLKTLNSASLTINAKAESVYYKALANFERTGQLASVVVDRGTVNGNTVGNAVYINPIGKNPLYTYAKLKKQIASIPMKQLYNKGIYKTEETIDIESALIRRIEAIGHLTNEILIDNLLEEAGITKENYKNFKKKRSTTIKKIEEILKGYVANGYIKKYSITSKGRLQYHKIIIHK